VPVTVLVGENRESGTSFLVDYWDPAPDDAALEALADSPLRKRVRDELVSHLAIVLHSPCESCKDGRAAAALEHVRRRHAADPGLGIAVLQLNRQDPAERLLLSFSGISPDGPDWVGVAFGRGKLMYPPLSGEEITESALNDLIEQARAACSCSKPLPSMGVDLPMRWPATLDSAVVALNPGAAALQPAAAGVTLTGALPVAKPVWSSAEATPIASESTSVVVPYEWPVSVSPRKVILLVLGALCVAVLVASRWLYSR
jgi:hypothetical protein